MRLHAAVFCSQQPLPNKWLHYIRTTHFLWLVKWFGLSPVSQVLAFRAPFSNPSLMIETRSWLHFNLFSVCNGCSKIYNLWLFWVRGNTWGENGWWKLLESNIDIYNFHNIYLEIEWVDELDHNSFTFRSCAEWFPIDIIFDTFGMPRHDEFSKVNEHGRRS